MIFTSLSPNTQKDDFKLALGSISNFSEFLDGEYISKLKEWILRFYNVKYVSLFESGRTGLYRVLKCVGLKNGDEVIVQAFTCVAVVNPIKWVGAKPIFVDIETKSFNADFDEILNKITRKTKAIIIQHTFGYAFQDIEKLVQYSKQNKIFVIEDCAHTIGGKIGGKKLGTLGDAAIISFGRDKAISGSFGGAVITNNKKIGENLVRIEKQSKYPSKIWIFRQVLYPVVSYITRKYYNKLYFGQIIHLFFTKLGILNKATTKGEKYEGKIPSFADSKLPNIFAKLALNQLKKIKFLNNVRRRYAVYYFNELKELEGIVKLPKWDMNNFLYPLRFPVIVKKRDKLIKYAQKKGVILGDWYDVPIAPREVVLYKTGYRWGSCPNAEEVCKNVVNLPMNINMTEKDANKVVSIIRSFYSLSSVD